MALDLYTFVVANHEVFVYAFMGLGMYSGAVYLRELIRRRMTQEKQGTKKGCADCIAMQMAITEIPIIMKNQADLRSQDLPSLAEGISNLDSSVTSLKADVTKLFNLIEQSWLAQINRLETSLHASMYGQPSTVDRRKRNQETGKKGTGKRKKEKGK